MNKKDNEKVVCPHCGAKIDTLLNLQSGVMYYKMDKDGNYKELDRFETDNNLNVWVCPECYGTITDNEEDAICILKWKEDKNCKRLKFISHH